MIAHIDNKYVSNCAPKWTAMLIAALAQNNHLVDCDNETKDLMEQCARQHCSTIQMELIENTSLYEITSLKRKYLTTIEVDGTCTQDRYMRLFGEPSLVLIENLYEWPVYKMMIDVYKHDREYKNIFAVLQKAVTGTRSLRELHAGGNGSFEAMIASKENTEYEGVTRYKIYPVTDSDRDSDDANYQPTPKKLYRLLCGIKNKDAEVDRALIDTLNQPYFNWHMWRKRTIENYFPPEAYESIGLNADQYRKYDLPERYFKKVDKEIDKYEKKDIERVASIMSRKDYEAISDRIFVDEKEMSEIKLFLLKMAKVI